MAWAVNSFLPRHQGRVAGQNIEQQENDEGHADNGGNKLQGPTYKIRQHRNSSISDHQQSWGYEDGPWKGPGPPLLVPLIFPDFFSCYFIFARGELSSTQTFSMY